MIRTATLSLFDADPDREPDLPRFWYRYRDRDRYRDRFFVPEYRSVRIAATSPEVLTKYPIPHKGDAEPQDKGTWPWR
jgi:hypothetical protein